MMVHTGCTAFCHMCTCSHVHTPSHAGWLICMCYRSGAHDTVHMGAATAAWWDTHRAFGRRQRAHAHHCVSDGDVAALWRLYDEHRRLGNFVRVYPSCNASLAEAHARLFWGGEPWLSRLHRHWVRALCATMTDTAANR